MHSNSCKINEAFGFEAFALILSAVDFPLQSQVRKSNCIAFQKCFLLLFGIKK